MGHLLIILMTLIMIFLFYDFFNEKNSLFFKLLQFIPFLFLSLVVGFQDKVGVDYSEYVEIYKNSLNINYLKSPIEPGLLFIFKLLNYFQFNSRVMLVFISLLTYLFIYLFIRDIKMNNKWILILLFFAFGGIYFQSFNLISQMLAVSMFLFSTKYIRERKLFKYVLMIFLGALIHKSILLLLPFYLIDKFKLNKGFYLVIIFFAITTNYIINIIFFILNNFFVFGYNVYLNHSANVYNKMDFTLGHVFTLTILILSVFLIDTNLISRTRKIYLNLGYIYILINFSTMNFMTFNRMRLYFRFFYLFIIIEIYLSLKDRIDKKIAGSYIIFIILLSFYNIYNLLFNDPSNEMIYKNIFLRF